MGNNKEDHKKHDDEPKPDTSRTTFACERDMLSNGKEDYFGRRSSNKAGRFFVGNGNVRYNNTHKSGNVDEYNRYGRKGYRREGNGEKRGGKVVGYGEIICVETRDFYGNKQDGGDGRSKDELYEGSSKDKSFGHHENQSYEKENINYNKNVNGNKYNKNSYNKDLYNKNLNGNKYNKDNYNRNDYKEKSNKDLHDGNDFKSNNKDLHDGNDFNSNKGFNTKNDHITNNKDLHDGNDFKSNNKDLHDGNDYITNNKDLNDGNGFNSNKGLYNKNDYITNNNLYNQTSKDDAQVNSRDEKIHYRNPINNNFKEYKDEKVYTYNYRPNKLDNDHKYRGNTSNYGNKNINYSTYSKNYNDRHNNYSSFDKRRMSSESNNNYSKPWSHQRKYIKDNSIIYEEKIYEESHYYIPKENNMESTSSSMKSIDNDSMKFDGDIICSDSSVLPITTFKNLLLKSQITKNYLHKMTPTSIQSFAIPAIFKNKNILCRAPTGIGKTLAFLVPIICKLTPLNTEDSDIYVYKKITSHKTSLRLLILAPTRELVVQIHNEITKLTGNNEDSHFKSVVLYGGTDKYAAMDNLRPGCDILVATPGRLCDFIEKGIVSLKSVKYFVLDEADRMLEMGFEKEMNYIRESLPKNKDNMNEELTNKYKNENSDVYVYNRNNTQQEYTNKYKNENSDVYVYNRNNAESFKNGNHNHHVDNYFTFMFSATFDKRVMSVVNKYLGKDKITIEFKNETIKNIKQSIVKINSNYEKNDVLIEILKNIEHENTKSDVTRVLIFVERKSKCKDVEYFLNKHNVQCVSLHGDKIQSERERALSYFSYESNDKMGNGNDSISRTNKFSDNKYKNNSGWSDNQWDDNSGSNNRTSSSNNCDNNENYNDTTSNNHLKSSNNKWDNNENYNDTTSNNHLKSSSNKWDKNENYNDTTSNNNLKSSNNKWNGNPTNNIQNKIKVLVATSVAARGLDIPNISLVINYDIPKNIKDYIHRIGRSGRCGKDGKSISFYVEKEDYEIKNDLIDVLKESNNEIPSFFVNKRNVDRYNNQRNYNNQQSTHKSNESFVRFNDRSASKVTLDCGIDEITDKINKINLKVSERKKQDEICNINKIESNGTNKKGISNGALRKGESNGAYIKVEGSSINNKIEGSSINNKIEGSSINNKIESDIVNNKAEGNSNNNKVENIKFHKDIIMEEKNYNDDASKIKGKQSQKIDLKKEINNPEKKNINYLSKEENIDSINEDSSSEINGHWAQY